jgi:hypothetical protein
MQTLVGVRLLWLWLSGVMRVRGHLVYTWDNSSLGQFYYNGAAEGTDQSITTPLPRVSALSRCFIARNVSTGNSPVKGRVRDFRIYGTALRYTRCYPGSWSRPRTTKSASSHERRHSGLCSG